MATLAGKNVRWLVMAPDDLVVDDYLSDDDKLKILVSRGVVPRGRKLVISWNDPETGYVITAADDRDMRRGHMAGRKPHVYARLIWDRGQPDGGVGVGGKLRRGGKGRVDAGDLARFGAVAVARGRREQLRRHRQNLIERAGAVGGPDRESRARIAAVDAEISDLAAAVAKLTR